MIISISILLKNGIIILMSTAIILIIKSIVWQLKLFVLYTKWQGDDEKNQERNTVEEQKFLIKIYIIYESMYVLILITKICVVFKREYFEVY